MRSVQELGAVQGGCLYVCPGCKSWTFVVIDENGIAGTCFGCGYKEAFLPDPNGDSSPFPPEKPHTIGRKFDQEKDRWDLLPMEPLQEVVEVLTKGTKKYAERFDEENWRKVLFGRRRYFAAALRHIMAWWRRGERRDQESGNHHLAHAICCLLFLYELEREEEEKKNV